MAKNKRKFWDLPNAKSFVATIIVWVISSYLCISQSIEKANFFATSANYDFTFHDGLMKVCICFLFIALPFYLIVNIIFGHSGGPTVDDLKDWLNENKDKM